ncbi:type IV pilus assembly protein PilC [Methylomagnum ishizawai]|uniref:Type IV pilus assembly protein PilC n=1 Tax=Methylomagnum ishizawai TaxID=1760988 RepID=A0A1Y6CXK1_9GAMM|nr:type II secretion system F family protein [Methylomagnum ishizawai]SMF94980.1 type IV pilus assembly protein PilC [Methylomagnum ishizawai]
MAAKEETVLYVWEGTDRNGARMRGELTSRSELVAKAELRRQGIKVVKLKKKPKPLFSPSKKAITTKDIAIFSRQLATMLSAGVPLVQAFEIVGRGHENPSMQELILAIKADVEGGSTLAEALGKHPLYFDELFCNLVHAGEQAGVLETLLHKIAEYKEKTESIKAKIKKALTYPAAVLVIAMIVSAILLIFVVPQFEALFKGFGADLPAFTKMVVSMSQFLQAYWYIVLGTVMGVGWVFINLKKRSKAFNHGLDRLILQIPAIGVIIHKAAIARFARTLSTMSAAGVPLVEALQSVSGATGNIVYSLAVLKMRDDVSTGTQLQMSMRQADLFPNMVIQMVAIGEESGSLDSMLGKVADFYEEEVDNAVDSLSSLLEPMIMAILGVIVGGLVIAMYLPIFKLGSAI